MQKKSVSSVLSEGKCISLPSNWLSGVWMQPAFKNIWTLSSLLMFFKNLYLPLGHDSIAFLIIIEARQYIFT